MVASNGCFMSLPDSPHPCDGAPPSAIRLEPEQRFDFLLEASEMLGSSLDYETTLSDLARFLVPRFAAFCAIEIADRSGGAPTPLAMAHLDPARVPESYEIRRRHPPAEGDGRGVMQVLRTGLPDAARARAARGGRRQQGRAARLPRARDRLGDGGAAQRPGAHVRGHRSR
jgi:hypothetical protein